LSAVTSFGKHEPPKPTPARRKCEPSRWSSPTPRATSTTSCADELADVCDLVDEADARREERVRRELHELCRRNVGAHELCLDRAVQLDDAIAVGLVETRR